LRRVGEAAEQRFAEFEKEFARYQKTLVAGGRVPASRDVILTEARDLPLDAVLLLTQKRTRVVP